MVAELTKLEVIAVDCEGVNLSREGELCLVQIGTESKVYLVDVLEHGRALFEEGGLRALLESTKVRKVLHDCRYDCRPPPPRPHRRLF
jgi:exonuclease 3'-5' domain-containing protein 1